MRSVEITCEVDFLKLSSYGDEKVSSGQVTDLKDIDADIEDRHIILVEDIVDTGLSMRYLVDKLRKKNPASIETVTLLHKTEATTEEVQMNYVGFHFPSFDLLGYGYYYDHKIHNLS